MIINHEDPLYRHTNTMLFKERYNGAFYYSKEICERIIPNVHTDYNWITVNAQGKGCDHAIVFIHNNKNPEHYKWLQKYNDLILVCGIPETCEKVAYLGRTIYLPLSINVEEVRSHIRDKTKEVAFAGRPSKRKSARIPINTDCLEGLPRDELLDRMAEYKYIYAVGRTAIEAKVLGCEVLPYDPRFPDPERWQVLDNLEAAKMLQEELDR